MVIIITLELCMHIVLQFAKEKHDKMHMVIRRMLEVLTIG